MTNYSKIVKPSLKDLNIYLILLFPVTLIAGPLITEILILGIIILSYPNLYKRKNIKFNRYIQIYFLAFLLYLLLNTLLTLSRLHYHLRIVFFILDFFYMHISFLFIWT